MNVPTNIPHYNAPRVDSNDRNHHDQAAALHQKEDCKVTDAECLKKPIENNTTAPAKKAALAESAAKKNSTLAAKKADGVPLAVTANGSGESCKVTDLGCLKKPIVVDKSKTAAGIIEAEDAAAKKKAEQEKADAKETKGSGLVEKKKVETPAANTTTSAVSQLLAKPAPLPMNA